MTLKSYLAGRRLCYAAIALRDTADKIIDIALQYGFSSQEAFTRAFVRAYGIFGQKVTAIFGNSTTAMRFAELLTACAMCRLKS